MCEEMEGEEGRGASQNACTRSCIEATGGILSTFWGKTIAFLPQKYTKNPLKLSSRRPAARTHCRCEGISDWGAKGSTTTTMQARGPVLCP
jgi:hypothetical protein